MKSKKKTTAKTAELQSGSESENLSYEEIKEALLDERAKRSLSVGDKIGQHIATILLYEGLTVPQSLTALCVAIEKFLRIIGHSADEDFETTYERFIYALNIYTKNDNENNE